MNIIKNRKGAAGCFIGFVVLILIVGLLVGGVFVVLNMTPADLKLADIEFQGMTLTELGLADRKIKDIIADFKSLIAVKEQDVVKNKFEPETEVPKADENLGGVLPENPDGEPDYTVILEKPLEYDKEYLLTYEDTTLAYIFNETIAQSAAKSGEESGGESSFGFIKNFNARLNEITISENSAKNFELRAVLSFNTTEIKSLIETNLGALKGLIDVPESVYLVSRMAIDANESGALITESIGLSIGGDEDNPLNIAIFKAIAQIAKNAAAANGTTLPDESSDADFINGQIGAAFSAVVGNLGSIGTADVEADGKTVVGGTVDLGENGISVGKITVITKSRAADSE